MKLFLKSIVLCVVQQIIRTRICHAALQSTYTAFWAVQGENGTFFRKLLLSKKSSYVRQENGFNLFVQILSLSGESM